MIWDLLMKTSLISGACLTSRGLVLVLYLFQSLPFLKNHIVTFDGHVKNTACRNDAFRVISLEFLCPQKYRGHRLSARHWKQKSAYKSVFKVTFWVQRRWTLKKEDDSA